MPLMTSFSSLSQPNFLPRRGSVNSPNQRKSLVARSGLLHGLGSNSHLNSRNIASWHKDQSNSGVVFLLAAAQLILHKPSSFPALHVHIAQFSNWWRLTSRFGSAVVGNAWSSKPVGFTCSSYTSRYPVVGNGEFRSLSGSADARSVPVK